MHMNIPIKCVELNPNTNVIWEQLTSYVKNVCKYFNNLKHFTIKVMKPK